MALQRNAAAWGRQSSNKGFLFQTMGNVRTSITILSFGPLRPLTAKWSTADTPRNRKHHHQLRSEYREGQSLECSRSTGGFSSMGHSCNGQGGHALKWINLPSGLGEEVQMELRNRVNCVRTSKYTCPQEIQELQWEVQRSQCLGLVTVHLSYTQPEV